MPIDSDDYDDSRVALAAGKGWCNLFTSFLFGGCQEQTIACNGLLRSCMAQSGRVHANTRLRIQATKK
eukprot:3522353-Amphidinium_carterae.1